MEIKCRIYNKTFLPSLFVTLCVCVGRCAMVCIRSVILPYIELNRMQNTCFVYNFFVHSLDFLSKAVAGALFVFVSYCFPFSTSLFRFLSLFLYLSSALFAPFVFCSSSCSSPRHLFLYFVTHCSAGAPIVEYTKTH